MSRHFLNPKSLQAYADQRDLEYHKYSPYHMRVIYEDRVTLDAWTTRRYWVKECNYQFVKRTRGGEKGTLPPKNLFNWLDALFFADEIQDEKQHNAAL